jgi:hypothetical protein
VRPSLAARGVALDGAVVVLTGASGAGARPLGPSGEPGQEDRSLLGDRSGGGKAGEIRPEGLKGHPVAYTALLLSVLSLLWLAVQSASDEAGYQQIRVGTQDCVTVPQDTGPAALFCRTTETPEVATPEG